MKFFKIIFIASFLLGTISCFGGVARDFATVNLEKGVYFLGVDASAVAKDSLEDGLNPLAHFRILGGKEARLQLAIEDVGDSQYILHYKVVVSKDGVKDIALSGAKKIDASHRFQSNKLDESKSDKRSDSIFSTQINDLRIPIITLDNESIISFVVVSSNDEESVKKFVKIAPCYPLFQWAFWNVE